MRRFFLGVLAALVSCPFVLLVYFVSGWAPFHSDEVPPAWESRLMHKAVQASVHRGASSVPAPPPVTGPSLIAGGRLYVEGCVGCHGGFRKPYHEDRSNYPPVPQLPHVGTRYSRAELFWIVKHGIRFTGMSAYGPFYTDDQMWALAAFLQQIDRLPPELLKSILSKDTT